MQIGDNYRIRSDERNIILENLPEKKNGETAKSWQVIGFYPTHQAALKAMLQREIRVPQEYQDILTRIAEIGRVRKD